VLICSNMAVAGDFTPVLALEIVLLDRLHLGRRGSCSGTSNQSRAGGSMAEERIDGRDREGGHLQGLRGRYWKPRNTLPASSTTCTSIRSTRSSGRGPSGVWRMRSRQPSRNSTRFPNLGRRRSWESSWRLGSRKLFEEAWSYAPKSQSSIIPFCLAGVARRLTPPQTIDFPETRFWITSGLPTTRPNIPAMPHDTVLAADYTSRISKRWMSPFCIWKTWITILSVRRLPFGSRTT